MNIGDRLKQLRKELDLTQEAFASRIGSVQNTITGYESGRRNPSAPVISLICREFDVSEEWLRNGSGEMFLPKKDAIKSVVDKYHLSAEDQIVIENYVKLSQESRDRIVDFIRGVNADLDRFVGTANRTSTTDDIYSDIPNTPEELERKFPPLEDRDEREGGLG